MIVCDFKGPLCSNIQFLRILYILYVDRFVDFRNENFQFLVKIN